MLVGFNLMDLGRLMHFNFFFPLQLFKDKKKNQKDSTLFPTDTLKD